MDQGSTMKRSAVHNFAPTVTKFCVMWEGQALPHDTKFGNSRCEIVGRRVIFIWSLIHGLRWSGLIKAEPGQLHHSAAVLLWFGAASTSLWWKCVLLMWCPLGGILNIRYAVLICNECSYLHGRTWTIENYCTDLLYYWSDAYKQKPSRWYTGCSFGNVKSQPLCVTVSQGCVFDLHLLRFQKTNPNLQPHLRLCLLCSLFTNHNGQMF